ncbi:CapA family protein [Plantactinospora siamensis]|uniref:CapA family protein n=1 Tax=Plantactinospora siamensis TaxID=555372 RepID=A0ABV6NTQ6_9ACTN
MRQRMVLGGDVNIQGRRDPAKAFAGLRQVFEPADVRFVNLEGALAAPSIDGVDIPHKPGWSHSDPRMVEALVTARIDGVSCANNVTYPAGAMLASLSALDAARIGHCGAGPDLDSAYRPLLIERDGTRFGFLAYTSIAFPYGHAAGPGTPGVATIRATTSYIPDPRVAEVPGRPPTVLTEAYPDQLARLVTDVAALRDRCDVLVVSCHWGVADQPPCHYQRQIGRAAVDAGADLIMGHGPHSIGGIETYAGRPICYSLGNLVFDWPRMTGRHLDGLLLDCAIEDRRLRTITVRATRRNPDNEVRLLDGSSEASVLAAVAAQSVA